MHRVCISAFNLHMMDCGGYSNGLMIVWIVHPLDDNRGFVNTRVQMALGLGVTWDGLC